MVKNNSIDNQERTIILNRYSIPDYCRILNNKYLALSILTAIEPYLIKAIRYVLNDKNIVNDKDEKFWVEAAVNQITNKYIEIFPKDFISSFDSSVRIVRINNTLITKFFVVFDLVFNNDSNIYTYKYTIINGN